MWLILKVNNSHCQQVETGKMELEVAPFNIMEELESLVDMFAVQSLGCSVDVMLDFSGGDIKFFAYNMCIFLF